MSFKKNKNESGQAVLIVLLSLSVVLIIVLYIMSRSVTDITLSSKEGNSLRAFSAAEAGIERALVAGSTGNQLIGDASFNASVSEYSQGSNDTIYPVSLKSGEIATFWFYRQGDTNNFTGNQVNLCWGNAGTTDTPAVEVSVFYKQSNVYKIYRKMLDPLMSSRTQTNSYVNTGSCTIGTETFKYQNTVNLAGLPSLQFMTVRILYNTTESHKIGIDVDTDTLPSQGIKVSSDGSFEDSNRRIEVYQLNPVVPSTFMNAVFSSTGITK